MIACHVVGSEHLYVLAVTRELRDEPFAATLRPPLLSCPGCYGHIGAEVIQGPTYRHQEGCPREEVLEADEACTCQLFRCDWRLRITRHETPQEAERRILYGDGSAPPRGILHA